MAGGIIDDMWSLAYLITQIFAEGSSAGSAYLVQQHMRQLLTASCVVFIGFSGSLDDPHFQALLRYADELNRDRPNRHVLLQSGPPKEGELQYHAVQQLASLRNLLP